MRGARVRDSDDAVAASERAADGAPTPAEPAPIAAAPMPGSATHQVRRQVEDVRVADVVAEGEHHVDGDRARRAARRGATTHASAPARRRRASSDARPAELLAQIEPVHREMIAAASTPARSAPSCRASRFRDVEPEPLPARRRRRAAARGSSHSACRFQAYCSAPAAAHADGERRRRAARASIASRAAPRGAGTA